MTEDQHTPTQAWFDYIRATIGFTTCGIIVHGGSKSYMNGELSSESKEKCLSDGPIAHSLLKSLLFASTVDNFQSYLSDIIYEILSNYPETMFGKKFDARLVFENPDIDSARRRIVDKYVMELGYKSADDLSKFMIDSFGIRVLSNKLTRLRLNRLIQIRNIVAHNRGLVNELYLFRSKSKSDRLGQSVKIPNALRAADYFFGLVNAMDREAMIKFNLPIGTPNG